MSILAAFTLGSFGTISGKQVVTGGNRVYDLINQARQYAINRNVPTALVMVTGSGNANWDYRLFSVYCLPSAGGTWTQVSKWTLLPANVIVDPPFKYNGDYNVPTAGLTFTGPTTILGTSTATFTSSTPYAYEVFLPTGALSFASPAPTVPPYVSVVSGIVNGTAATYTGKNSGSSPSDYYEITINMYTGMPKVDQPQ